MSFKMLALDLDDTLLNEHYDISAENAAAIRQAADSGVLVTLATGRMYRSALPYALQLGIDLPLITYHGALIKTVKSGETLYHQPVPLDSAREIIALAANRDYHINAYIDDELYVAGENEYSDYYKNIARVRVNAVGDLVNFLPKSPTKLTIVGRSVSLDKIKKELTDRYGEQLSIAISRPDFLEITDCQATKGRALDFLAKRHNIRREEVAAVGDSYNDLDMLIYAGIGVAVANAREEVKAVADVITGTNVSHGVAQFIRRYLPGNGEHGAAGQGGKQ